MPRSDAHALRGRLFASAALSLACAALAPDARAQSPAPAPAATTDTVVVTGKYRQPSAQVLQLDANNTTAVLTASDLTHTPDENVASSLGRVPGVTSLPGTFSNTNGVGADLPGRGEANYVALRGLDSEFNINTVNGVNVAQGKPYSREVQLNLLPPVGLQTIVVNKTFTADMQGDAIGGVIDFRTPNAYDFEGRDYFSVAGGVRLESRAMDYGRDPLGGGFSIDGAKKFGDHDQFGVYASAYYDARNFSNSIVDGLYPAQINGQYAFSLQDSKGNAASVKDPGQNLTLTGVDAGLTTGLTERWGGTLALDWRPTSTLGAYLRFTYAHETTDQQTYYSQVYGTSISRAQIGTTGVYTPVIGAIQPRFYYETNPERAKLGTLQAGVNWTAGALHLSPQLFASWGENDDPDHFELSARQPELAPFFPYGGSTLFTYRNGAPIPILPASEIDNISNVASYGARRSGQLTEEFSSQVKLGGKVDGVYDLGWGPLRDLGFGARFESSNRAHTVRDYTSPTLFTTNANDPSFGSLGFLSDGVDAVVPGVYDYPIPTADLKKAKAGFDAAILKTFGSFLAANDQCGGGVQNAMECDSQRGIEQVSSAYVLGHLEFGALEVIPGLRFEHTDISNTFYVIPQDAKGNQITGSFQHNSTTYDEPLPSILANWRVSPSVVYRASISRSYVRPSLFQLGGGSQISNSGGGAAAGGVTTITQGNPNLKPIEATNYDAAGEWLTRQGGFFSAAVFYKELNHFIYDSVNSFTNQTVLGTGGTLTSEPLNGGSGHVYGLELDARQTFKELPGLLGGFGVSGNLTLERSAVHTETTGLSATERLQNQPDLAGNAQLFYERGPYEAQLSYRYTGDYVSQYGTLKGLSAYDTWVRENHRVDLHLGYLTPWRTHLDFSIANLLDTDSYYATIGRKSTTIPTIVDSGRTYYVSAKYSF